MVGAARRRWRVHAGDERVGDLDDFFVAESPDEQCQQCEQRDVVLDRDSFGVAGTQKADDGAEQR